MPTKTLTKFKAEDVIYKKILTKAADINYEEMSKVIAKDAGAMVVITPLQKAVAEIKKENPGKPVIHLGVASGNLVFCIQGIDKYAYSETIVKNYAKLKADREKVSVINAQKGDKVIDPSSDKMAKAKGTTVEDYEKADLNKLAGDIVILAHGANVGKSPGQVYAKEFGGKKPKDIVDYLVKQKKLPLEYAGVVYLDGCFTAAGPQKGRSQSELNNFCKSVYDGLTKAGYKKLQVKGNLGTAATKDDGHESVVDAQMEKEIEVRTKTMQKEIDKIKKKKEDINAKQMPYIEKLKKLKAAVGKLNSDTTMDSVKKQKLIAASEKEKKSVDEKLAELTQQYKVVDEEHKKWFAEKQKVIAELKTKGISADAIEDLVGTFGPETSPN